MPISEPPNYVIDQRLANYFDHIDFYFNEYNEESFNGVWTVRAGVRRQSRDSWPVNYRATGFTMIDAVMNMRTLLIEMMEKDDLNDSCHSCAFLDD